MLVTITDANAIQQTIVVNGQEAITVIDGLTLATNTSQTVVAGTPLRSGWLFQNTSAQTLYVEDVNSTASIGKGYQVAAGQIISTTSGIPNSANAIQVIGHSSGLTYTFRQW
jgi:hypothetical protein